MSRDPRYQKLLNSKRWLEVKAIVWKRAQGLCERCKEEGIITGSLQSQLDCHHIVPVETGRTEMEMERLAYDVSNVRLLCVACHIKTHQEMHSFDRENVQANKQRKRDMFMQRNDPNYAIEQEQDDASISHAEREHSRTECNYQPTNDEECKPMTDIQPISK